VRGKELYFDATRVRARECQYRGLADRRRAEPQALPGRNRVGATSRALWQLRGPPERAMVAHSRLAVTTSLAGDNAYHPRSTSGPGARVGRRQLFSTRRGVIGTGSIHIHVCGPLKSLYPHSLIEKVVWCLSAHTDVTFLPDGPNQDDSDAISQLVSQIGTQRGLPL
jgi:hypothetical protein